MISGNPHRSILIRTVDLNEGRESAKVVHEEMEDIGQITVRPVSQLVAPSSGHISQASAGRRHCDRPSLSSNVNFYISKSN